MLTPYKWKFNDNSSRRTAKQVKVRDYHAASMEIENYDSCPAIRKSFKVCQGENAWDLIDHTLKQYLRAFNPWIISPMENTTTVAFQTVMFSRSCQCQNEFLGPWKSMALSVKCWLPASDRNRKESLCRGTWHLENLYTIVPCLWRPVRS